MGRGQISNDYVKGLNKWTYVIPDTVNENVLNIVCKDNLFNFLIV